MNGIRILALLALGGLSACGGGGGSSGGGSGGSPDDFAALDAEAADLVASTFSASLTRDLPDTGSATYEGVMGLTAPGGDPGDVRAILDDPALLGDLTMEADFGDRTISGTADNFQAADGGTVDGALDIADGTITEGGVTRFSAGLSGTLEQDGTATTYNGRVNGQFYDSRGDNIAGTVRADATTNGVRDNVYGAIIAEETD